MSSTSYDLKDESCVTMKDKEESERVASWIKKATREGCHVFIPPPPHLRRDCWKEREEEIDRKLKEEENERKKKDHHHNYRYKLYKNYFHILSFLHSFIYSIISTFIILLFTNKVSIHTSFRSSSFCHSLHINSVPLSLRRYHLYHIRKS